MGKLFVVADSTACLTRDDLERNPNLLEVPLSAIFDDDTFKDDHAHEEEFYRRLEKSKKPPTTSAPSIGDFLEVFEEAVEKGAEEIVCTTISKDLSATYENACGAARYLEVRHKEVRTYIHDSRFVSYGVGYQALTAIKMAKTGSGIGQIKPVLEDLTSRIRLIAAIDTLEYLRRGGRANRAQAFLGTVLRVKPILEVKEGVVHPLMKVRTHNAAVDHMARIAKSWGPLEAIAVSDGMFPSGLEDLVGQITKQEIEYEGELKRVPMTMVIAIHGGPKVLGVVGITKK